MLSLEIAVVQSHLADQIRIAGYALTANVGVQILLQPSADAGLLFR